MATTADRTEAGGSHLTAHRPSSSVQDVYGADAIPPPILLREESPARAQSTADISIDRYISREWHDREIEKIWRKTWQLACRVEEIPKVGDHVVYEIVRDSLIVVRSAPGEICAFANSCLHCGTMLRTGPGCVKQFRCPSHGWTWDLQGQLRTLPAEWDFLHIDKAALPLPQAQVATWGGFVFVNFDQDAEPLESYLESVPAHFAEFRLEDRYKAAHVAKIMPCNWKLAMAAFIEAYHVPSAHPEVLGYCGDSNTRYDVWRGARHVSRMVTVQGAPDPAMAHVPPETTIAHMRRDVPSSPARRSSWPTATPHGPSSPVVRG